MSCIFPFQPSRLWVWQQSINRYCGVEDGRPLRFAIFLTSPADIELIAENITQPDVFLFPQAEPADAEKGLTWPDIKSLLLAIEIISPSSIRFDRIIKRDYYMDRAGVSEYWVVDLVAEIVERWRPSSKTPTIDRESLTWSPPGAKSPLVIDLKSLFEEIRVAAACLGGFRSSIGVTE